MVIMELNCFWIMSMDNNEIIDMADVTVLIPVRIDSIIRLENLIAVIDYLLSNFNISIVVTEASKHNNHVLEKVLPSSINYHFVQDMDPVFYRTKYINKMASDVCTPYLGVWDSDVIFPPRQVVDAAEALRSKNFDVVFPYDGTFLDTGTIIRQMYVESGDMLVLSELRDLMSLPYGNEMRGGAFMVNTERYKAAGMENLNFYGWGPEDWERIERWKALGYRLKNITGNLYHLSHPRDINGRHNSDAQRRVSVFQKDITCFSSATEIKQRLNLDI